MQTDHAKVYTGVLMLGALVVASAVDYAPKKSVEQEIHIGVSNANRKLDRIERAIEERNEAVVKLKRAAQYHVKCLREESASSEKFRVSLHSAHAWTVEYNRLMGAFEVAPNASEGSQVVIDYYNNGIIELTTTE